MQANPPKEGMWLPILLEELQYEEMEAMGLELTPAQIFSANESSLKDAIVDFGGFCTASVISPNGLLLTNHHCGGGRIQNHSTIENDYLKEGFWAASYADELPNPGLTATFIVDIVDVTGEILKGITIHTPEDIRMATIQRHATAIESRYDSLTYQKGTVKSFYQGNRFFLFVTKTYKDVRLVGAPPSAVGKFGGDTDNWMWPRHTGDFSLFRIYADSNNNPAPYNENNVPYQPKHYLPISLAGVDTGDFTMVFGFPGRTTEYVPSYRVDYTMNEVFPMRIKMRTQRLNVMDKFMAKNDTIRLQYASKQSGIANGWKKWQGAVRGLQKLNAVAVKKAQEARFQQWADTAHGGLYAGLLPAYKNTFEQYGPVNMVREYLNESIFGIEAVVLALRMRNLVSQSKEEGASTAWKDALGNARKRAEGFYKEYVPAIDLSIIPPLLSAYYKHVPAQFQGDAFKDIMEKWHDDFADYSQWLERKSMFFQPEEMQSFLANYTRKDYKKLERDPLYQLMSSALDNYLVYARPTLAKALGTIDSLERVYMKALMQWQPNRDFYPDANATLRLTYGQVKGYMPKDGMYYEASTHLSGIMEKAASGAPEYVVPEKLKTLYFDKAYGRYGRQDTLPVCFIATNHTSGGNSGSPVINGRGQLIGLNFDRNWEGTMSDLMYDPEQVRNISVDIRYVLFIIDRLANADRLINEMTFVGN